MVINSLTRDFRGKYPNSSIASYDWTDITSGQGFVTFYPSIAQNSIGTYYLLSSQAIGSASTTGTFAETSEKSFYSNPFILPKTINGKCVLSGYADYTSGGGIILTAKLSLVPKDKTIGSSIATSAGEVYYSADYTFTLVKTITPIFDFVFKSTAQLKNTSPDGESACRYKFYYLDGTTEIVENLIAIGGVYATYDFLNPNPNKIVSKIEIYLARGGSSGTVYEKDSIVYGITITDLSTSVSSQAASSDQGILLELYIPQTIIKTDEILILKLTKSGGTGSFVCDPQHIVNTKETLKLNIPYKIDL